MTTTPKHCGSPACPIADHLPDAVARYDGEGRRIYANPAYLRATGLPREQLLGDAPRESYAPFLAGEAAAILHRGAEPVEAGQAPARWDIAWRDSNGDRRCYDLQAVPEIGNDGRVSGVLTVARDVSGRHETAYRLSLLEFALDQVREALYLIDEDARFVQVNGEASRSLGYSREELLSMQVFDIEPDFPPERWGEHWQAIRTRRSDAVETRFRDSKGRLFPVEVQINYFLYDGRAYHLALVRDISERRHSETLKRRYRGEFHALVENSPDTIARYDRNCIRIYANPAFVALSGKPLDSLLGKRPAEGSDSPALAAYEARMRQVIETGIGCELELGWTDRNGHPLTSLIRLTAECDENGQIVGVIGVGRDISALKESQRRLERTEALAHIGHWEWDCRKRVSFLSAEVCRIFGHSPGWRPHREEILAIMVAEDRERVIRTVRQAYSQGLSEVTCSYRISPPACGISHLHSIIQIEYDEADGKPLRLTGTCQDVTELKTYEYYLHDLTYTDTLTGLPNRTRLVERARQAITEAELRGKSVGFMLLDLDRFKELNETFGYGVGDRILFEVAERLRGAIRGYDTLARLSGDEFAIVLPEIQEAANLERVSRKIFDSLTAAFRHLDKEIFITASIGIALYPDDANEVPILLQYADAALSDAKERGRACYRFYSTELTAKSRERLLIEGALRQALPRQELQLHYQPKVDLGSGRIVGAEALMRWRHPELGNIAPDRFIPVAEESGLIMAMGEWALATAFRQASVWNRERSELLQVAVNLSTRQFHSGHLAERIFAIAADTGCEPAWIELEITESLLLDDNEEIRRTLDKLVNAGFSIAIDDFGTGYSALGYLHRFPIQTLKIDRSFVSGILDNQNSAELVKAILSMAHALHLSVVAEGIERPGEESFLQAHGSRLGQGYLYGKPVPAAQFSTLLAAPDAAP